MWHFYSVICGFRNLIIEVQNYGRLRTYERDCWYKFNCYPKCQTSHVKLICVPNGNKNLSEKKEIKLFGVNLGIFSFVSGGEKNSSGSKIEEIECGYKL